MLAVVVGALSVLGCVAFAWAYPWRVRRQSALEPRATAELDRAPAAERPAVLARLAPPRSWEAELARELVQAEDDRARVAAINEALGALEHRLSAREGWPRAATWLALASSVAFAAAGFIAGARLELAYLVPVALGGILGCASARRAGRRLAERERVRVDRLVAVLAADLERAEIELPERRRMRWQRRRRDQKGSL